MGQLFPPCWPRVPLRLASPSLPPTSALLVSTMESWQQEHMLPPMPPMLMLSLPMELPSQPSMLDPSPLALSQLLPLLLPPPLLPPMLLLPWLLLPLLLLLPQPPMLLLTLLPPLPSLLLLPQLLTLLPQLLLLLLLLLPSLDLSPLSSRLRMSSEMLPMVTRTSTVPSRSVAMLLVELLDLTHMLMRLESTLSTTLLMTLDSVWLVTTSLLPLSTVDLPLLPLFTMELLPFP